MLRATMDISAHAISLTSRPRPGQQGTTLVFACAGKTDPPSRLILSQTSSAGKSYRSDYVIAGSSFCAATVIGGGQ